MTKRLQSRVAFGKKLSEHSVWEQRIAAARIDIEASRLMCLKAADMMDKAGNKAAALEIAMIKVHAPTWRCASSTTPSRPMAAPASARISTSPTAMPASAPCASPTAPTKVHARAIAKLEYARHAG
jgi:hypothetical protein